MLGGMREKETGLEQIIRRKSAVKAVGCLWGRIRRIYAVC